MGRKAVSIEIVDGDDGSRSIVWVFADGSEVREPIDLTNKPTRRPLLRRYRIKSERMDKTPKKRI